MNSLYVVLLPQVLTFTPLCSTASCFRVTCHLVPVHRMTSNMALSTKDQKYMYQYTYDKYPDFQISIRLTLGPGIFELQATLRKFAPNDSKMTFNTKTSEVLQIYIYL